MQIPVWANWLLLLVGLAIIMLGGDRFTNSAVSIAQRINVPKVIIGAILVSLLTTLPEFTVSITSGIFDRPQTSMGNSIGSVICNIGLILGLCLLIRPLKTPPRFLLRLGFIMLLSGGAIVLLSLDGYLTTWDTIVLTFGLLVYLYYSLKEARTERQSVILAEIAHEYPVAHLEKEIFWLVMGGLAVVAGATLVVQNTVIVARWLGVPELIIALTLVALGTSLPELVVGITASIKGHGDIAAGNLIGASILDILWVRGPGGLVFARLPVERQTLVLDYPAMLIIVITLLIFLVIGKGLSKPKGAALLTMYIIYIIAMLFFFG